MLGLSLLEPNEAMMSALQPKSLPHVLLSPFKNEKTLIANGQPLIGSELIIACSKSYTSLFCAETSTTSSMATIRLHRYLTTCTHLIVFYLAKT
jgi:hypothetical protein